MSSNVFTLNTFLLDKLQMLLYNARMSNKYTNIRVLREDAQLLKIVASLSRESMLQTFKRLVQQEYERLQQKGGKHHVASQENQA